MGLAAVQEEILLLIFPEMLFSLLLFPVMKENEAIVIKGVKRYSKYSGYSSSLKYNGQFEDNHPLDSSNRIDRVFTAIDAEYLGGYDMEYSQFHKEAILRELNKSFIGFSGISEESEKIPVSTGNWG